MAESLIVEHVQAWAKAISAKDLEAVMSLYSPDLVSFDLDPPLRYTGADNKRRAWQKFFAAYPGTLSYKVQELHVTASEDAAFVHSLNHVKGRLAHGHDHELWVRWTACFRRETDGWLILHDHASVPANVAQGRALLDLTP